MRSKRLPGILLAVLVVGAGAFAGAASADRALVASGAPQPWTGGARTVTPIETIASQIASHIAGHRVTVSCEGVPSFGSVGSADALGLVRTLIDVGTGKYATTATVIELTSRVCGPLQRFAQAAQKPTRCLDPRTQSPVPCFIGTTVAEGSGATSICLKTACFAVVSAQPAYWNAYRTYAAAILTLAHEAIHTQQAIAGHAVPADTVVEAQADCSGMQWMPWVAMQLGDAVDDAQSIANFAWLAMYPGQASLRSARPYWSADCRPGGKLDVRAADATLWP